MASHKWVNLGFFFFGFIGLITLGIFTSLRLACEGQLMTVYHVEPTETQEIQGDQTIGQSFVAPHDNLNRVDIRLMTYNRENSQDVIFRLFEIPPNSDNPLTGQEKASITFNAADVTDQTWYRFNFPPISNSAQKSYFFMLESPNSTPGDAITVSGMQRDIYQAGTAYLGNIPVTADLAFLTCYQLTVFQKLDVMAEKLTLYRPSLWGSAIFYSITLIVYAFLLICFFWGLSRLKT